MKMERKVWIMASIRKSRVDIDIDEQDVKGGTSSRQTHPTNPGGPQDCDILKPQRNDIICMAPQPEDVTIAITSVKEATNLEHAREDYPDRVKSGNAFPQTAEDN